MSSYKISYTPTATNQIKDIAAWYNKQQKGLGKRFKERLKAEMAGIKRNPLSRSFRYDNVRFAVVTKFPYAAHYTTNEKKEIIIVHAILGFKEERDKWVREI
jgi:plasmid stabilization system protein ParE